MKSVLVLLALLRSEVLLIRSSVSIPPYDESFCSSATFARKVIPETILGPEGLCEVWLKTAVSSSSLLFLSFVSEPLLHLALD